MKSRSHHNIAARVPEGERLIVYESRCVKPLAYGMRAGVGIADQIGPVIAQSRSAQTFAGKNRERLPRLQA